MGFNPNQNINHRILLALGINPYDENHEVSVEQFVQADKIKKIKNAPLEEKIDFVYNVSFLFSFL